MSGGFKYEQPIPINGYGAMTKKTALALSRALRNKGRYVYVRKAPQSYGPNTYLIYEKFL
jgi:orotate phosphoribosyltransferase